MHNRIKLISYWLFLWAALCLAMIFWSSGIFEIVVTIILSGLFYQAGVGILKKVNRDRKISIGLLVMLTLMNIDTIIGVISGKARAGQALPVGLLSILILIISSTSIYYLLSNNVVKVFNRENNA